MSYSVRIRWLGNGGYESKVSGVEALSEGEAFSIALEPLRGAKDTLFFVGVGGKPEVASVQILESGETQITTTPWMRVASE